MALHKNFPKSPHAILDPKIRWFPADESLREKGYEKLLPPLVYKLRREVKKWRDNIVDTPKNGGKRSGRRRAGFPFLAEIAALKKLEWHSVIATVLIYRGRTF